MSSVYDSAERAAWLVAETPAEVHDLVRTARLEGSGLVPLTLANPDSEWNGRTVYVDAYAVRAISPPLETDA